MTPCARLVVALTNGGSETWTAERDGLAGFDVHPSGALFVFVKGKSFNLLGDKDEVAGRVVAGPTRLARVLSFGTWLALYVDDPEARLPIVD